MPPGFSRVARPRLPRAEQAVLSRERSCWPAAWRRGCGRPIVGGLGCRQSSRARLELRPILRKTYGRSAGYNPSQPNSTSARRKHELSTARAEVPPWCSSLCPRSWADDGILSKRTLCERTLPGRVPSDRFPDDSVRAHRVLAWGCPRVLQRGVPRCSWFVCGCDQTSALARCPVAARAPGELAA